MWSRSGGAVQVTSAKSYYIQFRGRKEPDSDSNLVRSHPICTEVGYNWRKALPKRVKRRRRRRYRQLDFVTSVFALFPEYYVQWESIFGKRVVLRKICAV